MTAFALPGGGIEGCSSGGAAEGHVGGAMGAQPRPVRAESMEVFHSDDMTIVCSGPYTALIHLHALIDGAVDTMRVEHAADLQQYVEYLATLSYEVPDGVLERVAVNLDFEATLRSAG